MMDALSGVRSVDLANRFGALMEALPDGVLIVDPEGRIEFVNGRLEDLSGYRRGDLLGREVEMLVPDAARALHERHRRRFHGSAGLRPMGTGLDIRLRRKDGTELPADIQLSPVQIEGEVHVLAAVRDIGERRNAEEAIRESEERVALASDRERIARRLGSDVIGSLFAVGMSLQSLIARTTDEDGRRRLDEAVSQLDEIIDLLRSHVFDLRS